MLIFEKILELIYPPKCVICEKILPIGQSLCEDCRIQLPYIKENYCVKCGKPVFENAEYCSDCKKRGHYFTRAVALWSYSPLVKKSLYRFKYSNKRNYAKCYGEELANQYGGVVKQWRIDGVIPVPLYKGKKRTRGYNQAELLAKELAKQFGIPVYDKYLERIKKTVPQKQLNDKERAKNVKNAFKIRKNSVKLKRVLLVDDIYTTGATVNEITRELMQAGITHVYVMTVCVGRGY